MGVGRIPPPSPSVQKEVPAPRSNSKHLAGSQFAWRDERFSNGDDDDGGINRQRKRRMMEEK